MTEKEYNQCVNLYADNVYRFILKNLRHEEDAKDVVQGAFEKLWINRQTVVNEKSKSFLFTVAYNQMIDHIRTNKRVVLKEEFSENTGTINRQQHDSRKGLQEALDRLMQRRTVIAIAHRLSTLQKFDRIVVMHNGHIVDSGTPSELQLRAGPYRDLLNRQIMPLAA